MYAEIYSIVDGALAREGEFADYLRAGEFVASIASDAQADGFKTDVFVIMHDHSQDVEECACVQYLTDHHPLWSFPADIPEDWDGTETFFAARFA